MANGEPVGHIHCFDEKGGVGGKVVDLDLAADRRALGKGPFRGV